MNLKIVVVCCFVICLTLLSCSTKKEAREQPAQVESLNEAAAKAATEILVYGSNTCDHCIDFRAQLDSAGLPYVFHDVELDQALYTELGNKIQAINYQGHVAFPVIEVNGKLMVAPQLSEVLAEL